MRQFIIEKPYVREMGEVTRLEALIKGDDFEKIHFFEVQKEYGKYLCAERSDAFVVSLFYFAIVNGYNIKCMAPMSEKLYYQLTRILMPTMHKAEPDFFNIITIEANLDHEPIKNEGAVGAAVSGGVDSFYSIVTNLNSYEKNHNLTHLLVGNSYNIFRGDVDTRRKFDETVANSQIIADELGLPMIKMYTNHSDFWFKRYQNIFCMKYASYPLALQKLFAIYYFSSGYEYSEFSLTPHSWDSGYYDALSVPQACNENFDFILSGAEYSRAEKMGRIADNKLVQKRLQVCNLNQQNCSICGKCMRTQFNLYANNSLEKFTDSFKIDEFYKRKNKTLIKMMSLRDAFDIEILNMMKQNNIKLPLHVKFWGTIGCLYYKIRRILKKIPFLYKLYSIFRGEIKDEAVAEIERYNIDKDFAKTINPDIV